MPKSCKIESAFSIGELVSHNDFHGGTSLSDLYDGIGNGHSMHYDIHIRLRIGIVGPTTKTHGMSTWPNFVAS